MFLKKQQRFPVNIRFIFRAYTDFLIELFFREYRSDSVTPANLYNNLTLKLAKCAHKMVFEFIVLEYNNKPRQKNQLLHHTGAYQSS